jgi:DNA-binding protein HU-beta
MNKGELVEAMSKKGGANKAAAGAMLDAFVDSVSSALKRGDSVVLAGFGTFSVAKRAARSGRNPRTGEAIKIPATRVPKFSAGATLKKTVSGAKK